MSNRFTSEQTSHNSAHSTRYTPRLTSSPAPKPASPSPQQPHEAKPPRSPSPSHRATSLRLQSLAVDRYRIDMESATAREVEQVRERVANYRIIAGLVKWCLGTVVVVCGLRELRFEGFPDAAVVLLVLYVVCLWCVFGWAV